MFDAQLEVKQTDVIISQATSGTILDKEPADQRLWLVEMGHSLQTWGDVVDFSVMRECEILYWAYSMWEADSPAKRLHPDAKAPWEGDFYKWAQAFFKRRGVEQGQSTIANKVRVYRDWLAPKESIALPDEVYIRARNEHGKIEETGDPELDWEAVTPDIKRVDYSKLMVASAAAKRAQKRGGDLSCDAWSAIFDPHATVADVQAALREDQERNGNGDDAFRFYFSEGIIYAREDGLVEGVAMILEDQDCSPLHEIATSYLLRAIGLKNNGVMHTRQEAVTSMAWVTGEEVVIASPTGYRVGVFSIEQAAEIRDLLTEYLNGADK